MLLMNCNMQEYINICLLGIYLRWCVSLYPYSGAENPPMYGDYEAQRHWQEITVNLPIRDWYSNSTNNDLEYWGLDYPPLTAYHSLLCGLIAKYINPDYVKLHASRGYESKEHKIFMRYTVLIIDLIIFMPGAILLYKYNKSICSSQLGFYTCFAALILYPGLYLIDYGHFQYNNASLGLFVISVAFLFRNSDYLSAIFFTLALNYKQMELYHALPFFFYFLGKYAQEKSYFQSMKKIMFIGLAVIITSVICWLPFLGNEQLAYQVFRRIFPIGRGLFEDKVASFWCSLSIIFKLKNMFTNSTMALICLVTTALLSLPSCIHLLLNPKPNIFKYSLINISFIFFLFSFHVHEKSILLVTTPVSFVYCEEPLIATWLFIISIISMLPLLLKDGLLFPTLICAPICYLLYLLSSKNEISKYSISRTTICKFIFNCSLMCLTLLTMLSLLIPPPPRYPDLYPVLISVFSSAHYCLFCIYFHYCQFNKIHYEKVKVKKQKVL